ncbi:MAG: hypothetical protein EOP01_05185 [Propionibacteriaceae bacterium]|nr:MAG: hypothetical protein EOP01_05185 [Propionibacteriaceae bacterium]
MTQKTPVVVLRPATSPGGSKEAWTQAWAAAGRTALVPDLTPQPGLVVLESPGLEHDEAGLGREVRDERGATGGRPGLRPRLLAAPGGGRGAEHDDRRLLRHGCIIPASSQRCTRQHRIVTAK